MVIVYQPAGVPSAARKALAARLHDVRRIRLGVLNNAKEFADQVVGAAAEALERDHGPCDVTVWRKGHPAQPAPFLAGMAARCDAVVNGVGH